MLKAGLLALVASFSLSDSVHNLTPDNFNEIVLKNPLPVAVEFYAQWCGPCTGMKPVFKELCDEFEGRIYCGGYDTGQENEDGASVYGAESVPTIAFYCNGVLESKIEHAVSKEVLKQKMEEFLERCD